MSLFRWASLAAGKRETPEQHSTRVAEEEEAARVAYAQNAEQRRVERERLQVATDAEYMLKTYGYAKRVPLLPGAAMRAPKNWLAADFIEAGLYNNPEWTACTTVGSLRTAVDRFLSGYVFYRFKNVITDEFLPFVAERQAAGVEAAEGVEADLVQAGITFENLESWAKHKNNYLTESWYRISAEEKDWRNFVKYVTFRACLWCLSISGTFRTGYESAFLDDEGYLKSGFLTVKQFAELNNAAEVTWVCTDLENYQSTKRTPPPAKPKADLPDLELE
jgi:hypothetical protein